MRVPGATRYVMDTENGTEQGGGPALAQSHVINSGNGRTCQIGTELVPALRARFGTDRVIATD